MLIRLVCSLSGRPDRTLLLLRELLCSRQSRMHLHKLDVDRCLCTVSLLQSLDSDGYRIFCICWRPSIHALLQTFVMSQRRRKVLAGKIQICCVSEDTSFRFNITVASTMPTFLTDRMSNADTLRTSTLSVALDFSASLLQGDRIRDTK